MQKEIRFQELIKHQQESGLTIKEFCSNHGLAPATFHYWRKKLKSEQHKGSFIPMVVSSLIDNPPKGSVCQRKPEPEASGFSIELVYPNGTMLRVKQDLDLPHLRALIHLYD